MAGPEKQRTKNSQGPKRGIFSLGTAIDRKSKNRETGDIYNAIKKSAQPGMFTNTGAPILQNTRDKVRPPKIDMGKAEKQERAEYEKPGFEGPSLFIRGMAAIDRTLSRIAVGQVVDTNIQKRARGARTGPYFRRHGPRKQKK